MSKKAKRILISIICIPIVIGSVFLYRHSSPERLSMGPFAVRRPKSSTKTVEYYNDGKAANISFESDKASAGFSVYKSESGLWFVSIDSGYEFDKKTAIE